MQQYIDGVRDFFSENWKALVIGLIVYVVIHRFRYGFNFSIKEIKNWRTRRKQRNQQITNMLVTSPIYRERMRVRYMHNMI